MTARVYPIVHIDGNRFFRVGELTLTPEQFGRSLPITYQRQDPDRLFGFIEEKNVNFRTLCATDAEAVGVSPDTIIHTNGWAAR